MTDEQWPDIPGYHLLDVAGKGGMGRVFRAEQEATGRIVALKMLSPAAVSGKALASFAREAETIARLEHPHILPVYDFGQWQGLPFLAMRYLERGSVADRLRRGAIEVEQAARWIGQTAEALAWAHGQGIVHKDVKPGNMLLDPGDNVYLADFGIAAAAAGPAERGAGSAAYMAPEQARGEAVDGRADVYALAASLFEMVTGQKPFPAATATAALVRHQRDPVPWARDLNPAVSPALADLIQWGMAKSPEARPATAAAFAGYLEQALAEPGRRLRPDGAATEPGAAPPATNTKGRWLIGLGLALALALAVLLWRWDPLSAPPVAPAPPGSLPPLATATLPPTPVGQLLFEDFTDQAGSFEVFGDASGRVAYDGGALRFTTLQPDILLVSPSGQVQAAGVLVEAEVTVLSGLAGGRVGLICRWQDEGHYTALAIDGQGTAVIWQQRGEEQNVLAQRAAPELAIASGRRYHLQALCDGPRLELSVNGRPAATATDPQPVAGDVVLMTHMPGEGELVVDVDELVVWRPDSLEIGD